MVRDAENGDLAAINRIENDAIEVTFAHFGLVPVTLAETEQAFAQAMGRYPWVVKEQDGQVIGFARATSWKPREAYRWTTEVGVYVSPNFQGQGVGKELYAALFPKLQQMGFRTILAGIAQPNDPSVRLHEAFGMAHVGTLPNVGFKQGEWRSVGYWAMTIGEGPPDSQ
jgi:L-amino acid N-acyltransferase YncA